MDQFSYIDNHQFLILGGNFQFFLVLSQIPIQFFKVNILGGIILSGTFALAVVFAGNDLVKSITNLLELFKEFNKLNKN